MSNIIIPSPLTERVKTSIERIRAFDPSKNGDPYYLAFSGGKDSVVVKALMEMAGVPFEAEYRHTSVDPPELVRFIYDKHKDVKVDFPKYKDSGERITMWNLIPKKLIPPMRTVRYCCTNLKESGGEGRMTVTGVRWEESTARKNNHGVVTVYNPSNEMRRDENFRASSKAGVVLMNDNDESRRMVEHCYRNHKTTMNPIIDWTSSDVWKFIRSEKISYCCLYDEGFHRLGCIGCPMGTQRQRLKEFARWPAYKHNYLLAFDRMLKERIAYGKTAFDAGRMGTTPESVFRWWIEDKNLEGQQSLFGEE